MSKTKSRIIYLIFTREEGAKFEVLRADKKQIEVWFEESIKNGRFSYVDEQNQEVKIIYPKFITIVKEIKNFDLVLQRER